MYAMYIGISYLSYPYHIKCMYVCMYRLTLSALCHGRDSTGPRFVLRNYSIEPGPLQPVQVSEEADCYHSDKRYYEMYVCNSDVELWDGIRRTLLNGCVQSLNDGKSNHSFLMY